MAAALSLQAYLPGLQHSSHPHLGSFDTHDATHARKKAGNQMPLWEPMSSSLYRKSEHRVQGSGSEGNYSSWGHFHGSRKYTLDQLSLPFIGKGAFLAKIKLEIPTTLKQSRLTALVEATIAPQRPSEISEGPSDDHSGESYVGSSSPQQTRMAVEQAVDPGSEGKKFAWKDHWYPVSLIEDLDAKLPTPFQLLGRELVLWQDREGDWRAFLDKCPHRLAPLSEGRIDENGWLQCSYHGWSFKPDGACGCIPQAATEGPEARAVFSRRACTVSFPTLVSQGLLFVWPDENGWEKATKTEPPKLPSVFSDPAYSTVTIQRDLFYGYDTLMENVSDPSHIDFAHHKVTGRRDRAKPLPFKLESSGEWGFKGANSDFPKISSEFLAPCYFINKIEIPVKSPVLGEKTWEIWICSFNIPMAPGKTRSIVCSARNFFRFLMPGPAWWQLVPRWHEHWTSNKVYDGDMIVLQGQEKIFLASSTDASDLNKQYTKLTFTPTQADRFVLAFRNWLRRHGNGQPDWDPGSTMGPLPSTVLSKHQMLDRFEQHTLKCSSCKQAHESFQLLQKIVLGLAVIFTASAGIPPDMILRVILASGALLSALLAVVVKELDKNFVFVDYVHAKID